MIWLWVAAGGALGALSRFYISAWVYAHAGRAFPWGTLSVNLLGSFLMGFLTLYLLNRFPESVQWRTMILTGFLGALTTFSTFSIETLDLLQKQAYIAALANVTLSVVLCIGAVAVGMFVAKWIL